MTSKHSKLHILKTRSKLALEVIPAIPHLFWVVGLTSLKPLAVKLTLLTNLFSHEL